MVLTKYDNQSINIVLFAGKNNTNNENETLKKKNLAAGRLRFDLSVF